MAQPSSFWAWDDLKASKEAIFTANNRCKLSVTPEFITSDPPQTLAESLNFSRPLLGGLWEEVMKISESSHCFSEHGIALSPGKRLFSLLKTGGSWHSAYYRPIAIVNETFWFFLCMLSHYQSITHRSFRGKFQFLWEWDCFKNGKWGIHSSHLDLMPFFIVNWSSQQVECTAITTSHQ